ncbi:MULTISPECIES: hypothetical protein [Microbacterium]|nr:MULTISPECIES: hypothetical protein [Microbacterium]
MAGEEKDGPEMAGPVAMFWTWMGLVIAGFAAMFAVVGSGH